MSPTKITHKTNIRDSQFELLRIIAMVFVMLYHANFLDIYLDGDISTSQLNPLSIWGYSITKCSTMCCVDLFILISGWYGLNFSIRKLLKLYMTMIVCSVSIYMLCVWLIPTLHFDLRTAINLFVGRGYWFVPAYAMLMILAPFLNFFIENSTRHKIKRILIVYLILELWLGWIDRNTFFDFGCSPLNFVGLYLIARYMRLFPQSRIYKLSQTTTIFLWFLLTLAVSVLCTFMVMNGYQDALLHIFSYISPFCTLQSVLILLIFSRLRFNSRIICLLGASSFISYLVHAQPFFYDYIYLPICKKFFLNYDGFIGYLYTIIWVFLIFILTALIYTGLKSIYNKIIIIYESTTHP